MLKPISEGEETIEEDIQMWTSGLHIHVSSLIS